MRTVILIFVMFFYISTTAKADGLYEAFDFGQAKAQDACDTAGLSKGLTVAGCEETSLMYRIAGGYQFTQMWGAEVSYGEYGKATLGKATVPGSGTVAMGGWQLSGVEIAGTGAFPLGKEFSLIGKVGIARTKVKLTLTSDSSTISKLAFGIGAQYDFHNRAAVRFQYENLGTVGDVRSTGTATVLLRSIGFVFKF